jgi:hypothetical protein
MSDRPVDPARARERRNRTLADLLSRQAGVVGRRQALALGMSPTSIQDRLNRGEWWPMHPGVYLNRAHPRLVESDLWAAVIAVPGSALARATAAWWWTMTESRSGRVDLVVPHWLLLEGWTVLRFTWFDLVEHPERVIAQIRQALTAGGRTR